LADPKHRYTHDVRYPFTYGFYAPTEWKLDLPLGDQTLRTFADALAVRSCCGERMGLTPDFTNPTRWRYQCAVDPKHSEDTEINIGF